MVEIPSPAFLRLSDGQVMGQAAAAKAGEDAPNVIKALAPSDVALTKDASQVLDISQIPVDDSAVKISSSRS
ncbi:MAG: hypothetical protein RIS75_1254, partial [Actinomycetota bacterium]